MALSPPSSIVEVELLPAANIAEALGPVQPESIRLEIGGHSWQQQAMAVIWDRVPRIVPNYSVQRLSYEDEEGDWCTLTELTIADALHFAVPTAVDAKIRKLEVRIVAVPCNVTSAVPTGETSPCCDSDARQKGLPSEQTSDNASNTLVSEVPAALPTAETSSSCRHEPSPKHVRPEHGTASSGYSAHAGEACSRDESTQSLNARHAEEVSRPILASACKAAAAHWAQDDKVGALVEATLHELSSIAGGANLQLLVPMLAAVALRYIEEAQEPVLFMVIEPLLDLKEGRLSADDLPLALSRIFAVIDELSPALATSLVERSREEASAAVRRLEAATCQGEVEVHSNVTCGECRNQPIFGSRYKSLLQEDFNLCQTCFNSRKEDAHNWVRVASAAVPARRLAKDGAASAAPADILSSHASVAEGDKKLEQPPQAVPRQDQEPESKADRDDSPPSSSSSPIKSSLGYVLEQAVGKDVVAVLKAGKKKLKQALDDNGSAAPAENATVAEPAAPFPQGFVDESMDFQARQEEQAKADEDARAKLQAQADEIAALLAAKRALEADVADAEERAAQALSRAREAWAAQATALADLELKEAEITTLKVSNDELRADLASASEQLGQAEQNTEAGKQALAELDSKAAAAVSLEASNRALQTELEEAKERLAHFQESRQGINEATSRGEDQRPEAVAKNAGSVASASVLSCTPVILKAPEGRSAHLDASSVASALGDVTKESLEILGRFGCRQAFCIGRVAVPLADEASPVAASMTVTMVNDGQIRWPETSALASAWGNTYGFSLLPLGPLDPGEAADAVVDLLVPPMPAEDMARSAWCVVDALTGATLGPLLLFDVSWAAR